MVSKKAIYNWFKSKVSVFGKDSIVEESKPTIVPIGPPSLTVNIYASDEPLDARVHVPGVGIVNLVSECSANELRANGITTVYVQKEVEWPSHNSQ